MTPQVLSEEIGSNSGRICLSLRILSEQVGSALAAGKPISAELGTLCGMGYLEGYVLDPANRDVILVGRRSGQRPILHLDDLAVSMRNIWNAPDAPYCSLDPQPKDVRAIRRIFSSAHQAESIEDLRAVFHQAEQAWGGQVVVVGGVSKRSRIAHVMICADYHMKKLSQGLVQVEGIVSYLDRSAALEEEAVRAGKQASASKMSMSRFWFHMQENSPTFLEAKDIVWLDKCSVVLLTEMQKASADGRLYDVAEDDPVAMLFAEEMSAKFALIADNVLEYADLENLYRLMALLRAMHFRGDVTKAGVRTDVYLNSYPCQSETDMPFSLPGLVNHKELHNQQTHGNTTYETWLFPMVCGGVSMEMVTEPRQFSSDATEYLTQLRVGVLGARPSLSSLTWPLPD